MAPIRLLHHDPAAVPPGGSEVVCSVGGPLTTGHKEPAGHLFHDFVLKQNGFWGGSNARVLSAPRTCRAVILLTCQTCAEAAPEEVDDTADQSKDMPSRSSSQSLDDQPPPGYLPPAPPAHACRPPAACHGHPAPRFASAARRKQLLTCRSNRRVDWKGSKKKKKSKRSKEADLYGLLGLQNERWTANEQQIKLGRHTLLRPSPTPCSPPPHTLLCPAP
jgi:hypothetical protein